MAMVPRLDRVLRGNMNNKDNNELVAEYYSWMLSRETLPNAWHGFEAGYNARATKESDNKKLSGEDWGPDKCTFCQQRTSPDGTCMRCQESRKAANLWMI